MVSATEIEQASFQLNITELFERAIRQARQSGRRVLVSHTTRIGTTDPLAFFARGRELARNAFFWERPELSYTLVGVGAAHTFTGEGAARFEQTAQGWHDLLKNALLDNSTGVWGSGPILMGGFSFDPLCPNTATWERYPDAVLVLPRVQLSCVQDITLLTINAVLDADSDSAEQTALFSRFCQDLLKPEHDEGSEILRYAQNDKVGLSNSTGNLQTEDVLPAASWKAIVKRTAEDIAAGQFQKVVLAREIIARADHNLDASHALNKLRQNYPTATLFAVARGERCFVGATPERLVQLQTGVVRVTALAGTMARGNTPSEDDRLGQELLDSSKNRQEHAVVVNMIKTAMSKVCDKVEAANDPILLKLTNLQHLYTPIVGQLQANQTILQLVEQLHPTPAVGGLPGKAALEAIREREQLDRGWYAAPIGWVDAHGEGEFVVALRSALLKGNQASLFVGCGIMGDSDPESEYQESCLKARVMLSALQR